MISSKAWLAWLFLLIACLSAGSVFAAPDDTDLVVETDEEPIPGEVDPSVYDTWIFGGFENIEAARSHIEGRTDIAVSEVARACELTTEQHDKLRLAANIEVRHIFAEAELLREQFVAAANDENFNQDTWGEVAGFQRRIYRDLLGDGSFFAKTMQLAFDAEKRTRVDGVRAERLAFQRQAALEAALVWFEESVPLASEQHDSIVALTTDALDKSPLAHDSVYMFYRVLSLPAGQLRQVLDDRQWKAVDVLDSTRKEYEEVLISQGSLTRAEADAIALARGR